LTAISKEAKSTNQLLGLFTQYIYYKFYPHEALLEYAFGYLDANSVLYCEQMAVVTMET